MFTVYMVKGLKRLIVATLVASMALSPISTAGAGANVRAEGVEESKYEKNGDYVFTFDKLSTIEVDDAAKYTVDADGSATFAFTGLYSQVFFAIPDGIDSRRIQKITFNGVDPSSFSIKAQIAVGDYNNGEQAEYGVNSLNLDGREIVCFVAMNLTADARDVVAESVTLSLGDIPSDSEIITKKLKDLEYRNIEKVSEDADAELGIQIDSETGIAMYIATYKSLYFKLPNDIDPNLVSKIEIKDSNASSFSYKVFTAEEYENYNLWKSDSELIHGCKYSPFLLQ